MSYNISNRRYTGSKAKLADWIMGLIEDNCLGDSFCDIFAGTGIVAEKAINAGYSTVIINDLLFSNNVIYKAFFDVEQYDDKKIEKYKSTFVDINPTTIKDNYFAKNFGGKFYSKNDAKKIGCIRETIEQDKGNLTDKEYRILLASLIYSADKSANTVGHFDAYIHAENVKDKFVFDLILPIKSSSTIEVYREDANDLAKRIDSDIVYIDPPYNSRQYSRFYHVLENLTEWKKPRLYGVALKPEPDNMSAYCRSGASAVFSDLIENLNCKYIVVSYNNTYASKSKSSKNKIPLEFIEKTLKSKGKLQVFEKQHQFFNAGKTDFADHKEFIFIVKVGE